MLIISHSIHFSYEEIFQLLDGQDPKLSGQVENLLFTVADQVYSPTTLPGRKHGDSILKNGMQFHATGVFWSKKELTRSTKWEEIVEQQQSALIRTPEELQQRLSWRLQHLELGMPLSTIWRAYGLQ